MRKDAFYCDCCEFPMKPESINGLHQKVKFGSQSQISVILEDSKTHEPVMLCKLCYSQLLLSAVEQVKDICGVEPSKSSLTVEVK